MISNQTVIAYENGKITCTSLYYHFSVTRISKIDYLYLRSLALDDSNKQVITISFCREGEILQLGRYVGIMPLPSGCILEILPKCFRESDSDEQARYVLCNMLSLANLIPMKSFNDLTQDKMKLPIHHSIIRIFLSVLTKLILKGLSSSYNIQDEERPVMRGKLLVQKQIRKPIPLPTYFWTKASEYSENRPENRIIRRCLDIVFPLARAYDHSIFSQIYSCFENIPSSIDVDADFRSWSHDRLVSHYTDIEPWCRLIISGTGIPISGKNVLPALLYQMDRLFESYVGACIRKNLPEGFELISQSTKWSLLTKNTSRINTLRPDFVIRKKGKDYCVLDAKWKIQEQDEVADSGDLLQLYAYGRYYLQGSGKMALLYPKTDNFSSVSDCLNYTVDQNLSLQHIPIDLDKNPEELKCFLLKAISN